MAERAAHPRRSISARRVERPRRRRGRARATLRLLLSPRCLAARNRCRRLTRAAACGSAASLLLGARLRRRDLRLLLPRPALLPQRARVRPGADLQAARAWCSSPSSRSCSSPTSSPRCRRSSCRASSTAWSPRRSPLRHLFYARFAETIIDSSWMMLLFAAAGVPRLRRRARHRPGLLPRDRARRCRRSWSSRRRSASPSPTVLVNVFPARRTRTSWCCCRSSRSPCSTCSSACCARSAW